jgi:hypothetical protein
VLAQVWGRFVTCLACYVRLAVRCF